MLLCTRAWCRPLNMALNRDGLGALRSVVTVVLNLCPAIQVVCMCGMSAQHSCWL